MEALPSLLPAEATCPGGTWKVCADAGDVEAQIMLGLLYSTGRRVERDLVQAHQWPNLAALAGAARARDLRGQVARDMSPAEIAQALKLARQWLRLSRGLTIRSAPRPLSGAEDEKRDPGVAPAHAGFNRRALFWVDRAVRCSRGRGDQAEGPPVAKIGRLSHASPDATTHDLPTGSVTMIVHKPLLDARTSRTLPLAASPMATGPSSYPFDSRSRNLPRSLQTT